MKYFVYAALTFIALLLFLPQPGTTEVRNLPLLILILFLIVLIVVRRLLKYAILMAKTKTLLKQNKINLVQCSFLPWASRFYGRYSISFQYKGKKAQIILLSRKRKYQRYHFAHTDLLEFYQANRVAFKRGENEVKLSKHVTINQVGKQKIKWNPSAEIRVILFDTLPNEITDSAKKENLGAGDQICASDVYLLDLRTASSKK